MTTVYFVRHAQAENQVKDDVNRPLTEKGLADRARVTTFLADKGVDLAFSSPYKRAMDTIAPFCEAQGLTITTIDDFRERKVGNNDNDAFWNFTQWQWEDLDNKLPGGDSLREVQQRGIAALEKLLEAHAGKTFIVGSHGTALCTVMHYYTPGFGHSDYADIADRTPFIVRFVFDGKTCTSVTPYNVFADANE